MIIHNRVIEDVMVSHTGEVSLEESTMIVLEEKEIWAIKGKELARVYIDVDGEELVVESVEKSPVKRVRRITGYLSNMTNFNQSKADEAAQRVAHM